MPAVGSKFLMEYFKTFYTWDTFIGGLYKAKFPHYTDPLIRAEQSQLFMVYLYASFSLSSARMSSLVSCL